MKNKAFNILIVLALLLGAGSIYLIRIYVKQQKEAAGVTLAGAPIKIETSKVLVASSDIAAGKDFGPLSYSSVDMPKNLVPETAISVATALEGKVAAVFIPKGDMILASKAVLKSELPRASLMIEPGRRIISIPVTDLSTSGFVVKVGDYVDLAGTFPLNKEFLAEGQQVFGSVTSIIFMQRVKVVDIFKGEIEATGGDPKSTSGTPGASGKRLGEGNIATFDVSPKEAEVIMTASRVAQGISLILRRLDDTEERKVENPYHQKVINGLFQRIEDEEVAPVAAPTAPPVTRKKVL